jgi:hypothetical protein
MISHGARSVTLRATGMTGPLAAAAFGLMLVATPALPQVRDPNASTAPTAPVVIAPRAPLVAEPPHSQYPDLNPIGVPECRNECMPVACP